MRRLRFMLFLLLALIGVSILVHFIPLASRLGAHQAARTVSLPTFILPA